MLFKILMLLLLLVVKGSGINPTNDEVMRLLTTRRVGHGTPATLGELPYQVAIKTPAKFFVNSKTYHTFCGGSIIKSNVVLSAAHCFVRGHFMRTGRIYQDLLRNEFAVAGNIHNNAKYSIDDTDVDGQWRRIKEITFPVTYNFPKDDIAVLYLWKDFTYDTHVSPIAYAQRDQDYGGLHCLASGYGRISDREQSEVLRKANLEILSVNTCNKLFEFDTTKMVCTTDEISDVLEGDSGGPLVCVNTKDPNESPRGLLVGVVSGGYTGVGSVFTRVSSYKKFIAVGTAPSIRIKKHILLLVSLSTMIV